ncbi:hypothetical protein FISHEDRAFT_59977 [Fistulina hepatica ATCC 64428]|uniref:Uncharacterized protein n=1 Tax=Fistulina hepatica ATCC 64428 TaxID=1128425 RepID=A0A0D7A8A9_9AGAR|nr:hypothetical protein FISHEDRAFT_59977 [Fistulina hepatica ATCC 64428]
MTEYTSSPEAIQEYMTSQERTAHWLQKVKGESPFRSPSVAPSKFEDALFPSRPPSEAESSNSVPPRMLLRYGDGRPDEPIPHVSDIYGAVKSNHSQQADVDMPQTRGHTMPLPSRHASRSTILGHFEGEAPTPRSHSSRSKNHRDKAHSHSSSASRNKGPAVPPLAVDIPRSPRHGTPSHKRSRSLPLERKRSSRPSEHPALSAPSSHSFHPAPMVQSLSQDSARARHSSSASPKIKFIPSPWHSQAVQKELDERARRHHPPAIVYAPAHGSRAHYSPPAIYNHPPLISPTGVVLSQPLPPSSPAVRPTTSRYPPLVATPYPSAGARQPSLPHLSQDGRDEKDKRSHKSAKNSSIRSPSSQSHKSTVMGDDMGRHHRRHNSSPASDDSGSTYYVIPHAGQKVHVINPEESICTSTTAVQSPASAAISPNVLKKPLIQRLLDLRPKLFSFASSSKSSFKGSATSKTSRSTPSSGATKV